MMQRMILVGMLTTMLAGCITTTTGRNQPVGSDREAAEINARLGINYLRKNELEAAREKLERAVEQDPRLAAAHSGLALVYERIADYDTAEKHYRRAVSLEPRDPDILNAMAVFQCARKQRPDDAMYYFEQALDVPPTVRPVNRAVLLTNAGTCLKRSNLARAENYLRQAVAVDPRFSEALLQLADVTYERGNFLQSRGFIERYMDVAQPSPAILWLAVRVERALGDVQSANNYGTWLKNQFPAAVETRMMLERQWDAG